MSVQNGTIAKLRQNTFVSFLLDVFGLVGNRKLSNYAQMVAYNLLFATAPLLIVITAGAGAVTRAVNDDLENPAVPVLDWMQANLPEEAAQFLRKPIESAINQDAGWIFSVGALLALWGARGAISAIMVGLNQAYGIEKDPRNFFVTNGIAVGLAVLLVLLIAAAGTLFTLSTWLGDDLADALGFGSWFERLTSLATYPFLILVSTVAVVTLHRWGPARSGPWREYLPGALFTVIGIYIATILLSFWFRFGGGYAETYGIFGSVLAFVFYLFVMALVVLIGGAINAVWANRQSSPAA